MRTALAMGGLLWALHPGTAVAGEFITDIGEDRNLEMVGGWPRVFPDWDTDGWHFLWASGGNFNLVEMSADYEVVDFNRKSLTPLDELKDHAISACPGGGYLHVASANIETPNDSAYAFRYDDDFELLSWSPIEERIEERDHNDLPVACGPLGDLTVFGGAIPGGVVMSTFFEIDEDAGSELVAVLPNVPRTAGLTLRWEPDTETLLAFEMDFATEMDITRLDANLQILEVTTVQVMGDTDRGRWPQGSLRIGDYYLIAYVVQGFDVGWTGLVGDIWIAVMDMEFNVLQTEMLTQNTPPDSGMTPGLARRGDKVVMVYDKSVVSHLVEITIDLEAFGVSEGDTGGYWDTGLDTGDPQDTEDTEEPEDTDLTETGDTGEPPDTAKEEEEKGTLPTEACACVSAAGAGSSLGLLALFVLVSRRGGQRDPVVVL